MTLTCEELTELIYDYESGELVEERRELFHVHIAGCPRCTIYVDSYRHTVRMTKRLPRSGRCRRSSPRGSKRC